MTLEARSNDVSSLKGDAGWRRESSWSSRHGPASLRFLILNPAMHQGQAVARGPRLIGAPAAARAWPTFAGIEHAVLTSHVSYKSRHETA